jgi:hypothetical protein
LSGVVRMDTGEAMPADSDSLILAMNQGRPMALRLMWGLSRAAMDVDELLDADIADLLGVAGDLGAGQGPRSARADTALEL